MILKETKFLNSNIFLKKQQKFLISFNCWNLNLNILKFLRSEKFCNYLVLQSRNVNKMNFFMHDTEYQLHTE